jgi:hypothetical protein
MRDDDLAPSGPVGSSLNTSSPFVIRCPDRNDGKHPRGGELNAKGYCRDCGKRPSGRRRPNRHRASSAGRTISSRDYEGW